MGHIFGMRREERRGGGQGFRGSEMRDVVEWANQRARSFIHSIQSRNDGQ
jgi:hypothetical protein